MFTQKFQAWVRRWAERFVSVFRESPITPNMLTLFGLVITGAGAFLVAVNQLLLGGLVAAGFGLIFGLPSIRTRGEYLAIVTLAFTIGSWVLDFTTAGRPGMLAWISLLSLTQTLHTFEQGLFSVGLVAGLAAAIFGFAALAAVWLPPGIPARTKFARAAACVVATAIMLPFIIPAVGFTVWRIRHRHRAD